MQQTIVDQIEDSDDIITTLKILNKAKDENDNNCYKPKLIKLKDKEDSIVFTFKDEEDNVYCIKKEEPYSVHEINDFIIEQYDYYDFDIENTINENFWNYPEYLYHATNNEYVENILENGLIPKNKTRGLNNRYIPSSVFTVSDPSLLYNEIYGDTIIKIDTPLMKKDNLLLFVQKEPEIYELEQKRTIAYSLGVDYEEHDVFNDVWEQTYFFTDKIPQKYLSILEEKEYY